MEKGGPWSPDEEAQLRQIESGTRVTNTLRDVGKLSPRNFLAAALEAGETLATGSPLGPIAAASGIGARIANKAIRNRNTDKLMATILAGGQAPAAVARPPVNLQALSNALAANQTRMDPSSGPGAVVSGGPYNPSPR